MSTMALAQGGAILFAEWLAMAAFVAITLLDRTIIGWFTSDPITVAAEQTTPPWRAQTSSP